MQIALSHGPTEFPIHHVHLPQKIASPRDPACPARPTQAPRVLHVTEASLGGLRRHIADLIIGLHGLNVAQGLVFAPNRADGGMWNLIKRCERVGIPTFALSMTRSIAPIQDVRAFVSLLFLIREFNPRILHLHSSKAGGIGRLTALFCPKLCVVYTPNGAPSHLSPVYQAIETVLGHLRTDRLIAVSATEGGEFRTAHYVDDAKLAQIDSGVDANEIRLQAETGGIAVSRTPLVVVIGRMTYQKNPLFLADVSALVLRDVPDARFIWVGDGELRAAFDGRLGKLGVLDKWSITGWVDNPFIYMKAATVCALASRYESYGYVTLEAMVLGKPVVATDVAGSTDIIVHGETGFLIDPDDAVTFASSISALLREPALRRRMGANAQRRAEAFSRDRMAAETLRLYQSIVPAFL